MKRKLFISISTIIICIMAIIGVSYAVLQDNNKIPGGIVVGSVDVEAQVFEKNDEQFLPVEKIGITNIIAGETYTFKIELNNTGDYSVRYRNIFDIIEDSKLTDVLTVKVNEEEIDFRSNRGVSSWVKGLESDSSDDYLIEFTLNESIDNSYAKETFDFDLTIEAIEDRDIFVSCTDDLNKLIDGEYAILSDDVEELTISKNIYLDLNGFNVTNLNVVSSKELFIELTNGTITNLDVQAIESTIYCYTYFANGSINSNTECFNYVTADEGISNIELQGGTFVADSNTTNNITTVESNGKEKLLIINKEVNSLLVKDDVKVINNGTLLELTVEEGEFEITGEGEFTEVYSETFAVVSEEDVYRYVTEDGVTKRLRVISLENIFDYEKVLFVSNTYELSNLVINQPISFYAEEDVIFNLENQIEINSDVSFDNITFSGSNALNINDGKVVISNCEFITDEAINVNDAVSVTIENTTFSNEYDILVDCDNTNVIIDNDHVLYYSNSLTVVSETGKDLYIEKEGKMFVYYCTNTSLEGLTGEVHLVEDYYLSNVVDKGLFTISNDLTICGYNTTIYGDFNIYNCNVVLNDLTINDTIYLEGLTTNYFKTKNVLFNNEGYNLLVKLNEETPVVESDANVAYIDETKEFFGNVDSYIVTENDKTIIYTNIKSTLEEFTVDYIYVLEGEYTFESFLGDITIEGINNVLFNVKETDLTNITFKNINFVALEDVLFNIDNSTANFINCTFTGNDTCFNLTNSELKLEDNVFNNFVYAIYIINSKVEGTSTFNTTYRYYEMGSNRNILAKSLDDYMLEEDGQDATFFMATHTNINDILVLEEVYILSGTYTISDTIELNSNNTIIGVGSVIITNKVFSKLNALVKINSNVTLENLSFVNVSVYSKDLYGIVATGDFTVYLKDIVIPTTKESLLNCSNAYLDNVTTSVGPLVVDNCNAIIKNSKFQVALIGVVLQNGATVTIENTIFDKCVTAVYVDNLENEDTKLILGEGNSEGLVIKYAKEVEDDLDDLLDLFVVKKEFDFYEKIQLTNTYDLEVLSKLKIHFSLSAFKNFEQILALYEYKEITVNNILEVCEILESMNLDVSISLESNDFYHTDYGIVVENVTLIKIK